MPSVTPEIYGILFSFSRWLFVFFALMLLFFALAWHRAERKERKERFRNLPGAGTVGEMVVLSGGEELAADTWFPVPREGVLGSLRSCDLVVPCPGVRSQHLDFSWQDGTGLLIRPRSGCEVLIDGIPVSREKDLQAASLIHGSVLQVGSAVLRLQLFAALSHTNQPFHPAAGIPDLPLNPPGAGTQMPYVPFPADQPPVSEFPPSGSMPFPAPQSPSPAQETPVPSRPDSVPPRRKRADRWKEDWSE